MEKQHFATMAVHAGQVPDPTTGSRAVPIYQTTAYNFNDTEHGANLFSLKESGNIYTRLMNPTTDVFEKRMAALDGGIGALAFASGHAAIVGTLLNFLQTGDEIVSSAALYGGTYNLFAHTLAHLGIKVNFVDASDPENFRAAINDKTKAVYTETIGNPKINLLDVQAVADIAHENKIPFIIDNTFLTPYLFCPIEYGADIVIHSATKFIGGHGTSMGGVVVDSGKFDWNSDKFPLLSKPDPSYHDLNYAEALGASAFITRLRVQVLRDYGACISPFNSFQLLQGLETLHLRMARHSENALAVAEFLAQHDAVAWVNYPNLHNSPDYALNKLYLKNGAGAMLTFGIKGDVASGARFIDSLKLLSHLANVGDAKSLVIHPASTTHSQLSSAQRVAAGVPDDMIRLSIGIEDARDIIADLSQALQNI